MAITYMERPNLVLGDAQNASKIETVASGQVLTRGTVVKLNDDGKLEKIATGDTPYAVVAEDVDATGGDTQATVFYSGWTLREAEMDFGDGTADEFRDALRQRGLIITKE